MSAMSPVTGPAVQLPPADAVQVQLAAATCPVSAIDDWATFAKYRKGKLFPAMSVHGRPPFWGSDP